MRAEPGTAIAESDSVLEASPPALFTALLVEPDHVDRVSVHSALADAGVRVTATNNYDDARGLLQSRPPLVLVTNARLGAGNGLELARYAATQRPRIAIVVTSSRPDAVLQAEVERLGATFVLKPTGSDDLLAAIYRTAFRSVEPGAEPVRPPFERRRRDRRVAQEQVAFERRSAARRRDIALTLMALPAAV